MIDLNTLAVSLMEKLNVDVPSYKANTDYLFYITANEGEFKKAERLENSNKIIKYINGILRVEGDERTGIVANAVTLNLSCSLDILIPDIELTNESEQLAFKDAIIAHINDCFALPTNEYITQNNVVYSVVAEYTTVSAGVADIRTQTGQSLSASVGISFFIVAAGFPSSNIEFWFNGERIYPTRVNIVRESTSEPNFSSRFDYGYEDGNPNEYCISKTAFVGSALQINIIKPNRLDALDEAAISYMLAGTTGSNTIKIKHPRKTSPGYSENTYSVIFSTVAEGVEGMSVPSFNITLVENFDIPYPQN